MIDDPPSKYIELPCCLSKQYRHILLGIMRILTIEPKFMSLEMSEIRKIIHSIVTTTWEYTSWKNINLYLTLNV